MSPEAQGWCPYLAVASVYLIQSMVTDGGPSRGCMQRTKPVYLLWFVFTCLKTPGKCDDSGVTSCHYILLLEASPSCPQKQEASCGFRQHSHRRANGESPQLPRPGRPRGLLVYKDGCYIHSSVHAWSPVTTEAPRCNASCKTLPRPKLSQSNSWFSSRCVSSDRSCSVTPGSSCSCDHLRRGFPVTSSSSIIQGSG